jgi:hypothetical protein
VTDRSDAPERPVAGEAADGAPAVRPTGHARVDAVLARAAALAATPVAEHADLYEAVHAQLAAKLSAEPETVPAGPVPPPAGPARDAGER